MRARDQKGFAVTLELIVLLSVFGTVLLFGMSTLDEYIVGKLGDFFGNKILIFDITNGATGPPRFVGKAVGFNDYEAPYIVYRDQTASLDAPLAALLGVREGGFTSRQYVFYDDLYCKGNAWVLDPTHSDATSVGPVSDFYELQGRVYAIGVTGTDYVASSVDSGVPGPNRYSWSVTTSFTPGSRQNLYRSHDPKTTLAAGQNIRSYWISEAYNTDGSPPPSGSTNFASPPIPGRCVVGSFDTFTAVNIFSPNNLYSGANTRFISADAVGTKPLSDYAVASTSPLLAPFWIPVGKLQNSTVNVGTGLFGTFNPAGTETTGATATSTDPAYIAPGTEGTDAKTLTVTPGKTTAPKKEGS